MRNGSLPVRSQPKQVAHCKDPGTRTNYPGTRVVKKILSIPGYPGNRYSALDSLVAW
jgi:hypothetical protein